MLLQMLKIGRKKDLKSTDSKIIINRKKERYTEKEEEREQDKAKQTSKNQQTDPLCTQRVLCGHSTISNTAHTPSPMNALRTFLQKANLSCQSTQMNSYTPQHEPTKNFKTKFYP